MRRADLGAGEAGRGHRARGADPRCSGCTRGLGRPGQVRNAGMVLRDFPRAGHAKRTPATGAPARPGLSTPVGALAAGRGQERGSVSGARCPPVTRLPAF